VPLVVGLSFIAAGLILLLVGKLANDGRLKRNQLAGIRTRGTTESNETWLAAHQAAWPSLFWAGVASVVVGLSLAVFEPSDGDSFALMGIGVVSMIALVVSATKKATRAAAKVAPGDA